MKSEKLQMCSSSDPAWSVVLVPLMQTSCILAIIFPAAAADFNLKRWRDAEPRFACPYFPSRLKEKGISHLCRSQRHSFYVDRQHRAGSNPFF